MTKVGNVYPRVDMTGGSQRFSDMEQQVLRYWDLDQTFQASCDNRETSPEYVFYDGPPFANGLPHYGHLLTGYVKDIIPRYKTMRGYKVARVFGWDCHACPPNWRPKTAGYQRQRPNRGHGPGKIQRVLRPKRAAIHGGMESLRHPAGPVGRF